MSHFEMCLCHYTASTHAQLRLFMDLLLVNMPAVESLWCRDNLHFVKGIRSNVTVQLHHPVWK